MMTDEQFNELVIEIHGLGYDMMTAARYAVAIGDTPEFDDDGQVVVRDEAGAVVAKLRLAFFDEE